MIDARLSIDDAVAERYPGYRAAIVYADGLSNGPSDAESIELLAAAAAAARSTLGDEKPSTHPHIAAWRQTFQSFGAKPSRYPSSAEALLRRVVRGDDPPAVNKLVDAYNAVSIRHLLPVGGEDRDRLEGPSRLVLARGNETFVAFHQGEEETTSPEPGEVVWADAAGVTCRRWNWRQCLRTRLMEESRNAYFVVEAMAPFGPAELDAATDELCGLLRRLWPGCALDLELLP